MSLESIGPFDIMIEVRQIHKKYGDLEVLRGIDLSIKKSEIVSIVGASGAGKTTLLQIMGTLDRPDRGNVLYDGQDIIKYKPKALSKFRNEHIGFVFQFHHLLPEFSALENICIPAFIRGVAENQAKSKAMELLEMLGLTDRFDHKPSQLSGGEQQRVAVARSLINDPIVVMADEPSGNLDSENAQELHKLFFTLRRELDQTFVIVTHNDELANSTDRKFVMKDGLIINEL